MKNRADVNLERFEGRSFILGREGHIYIDSTTASKQHAEIRIMDGRIHLRDLDSTNGTFLLRDNSKLRFDKGFVEPEQTPEIAHLLIERGFTAKEAHGILGGNFMRVARLVWR